MTRRNGKIAIIESLGDLGIGTYTYELAEGLVEAGCHVDVYGLPSSPVRDWARRHTFRPELPVVELNTPRAAAWVQRRIKAGAFAMTLARRHYDWVWTQWPTLMGSTLFWRCARTAGLRVAHTVHNVLPHERAPDDLQRMQPVYSAADALIVHSQQARADLERSFASLASRVMVQPHGAYTCYPPPSTDRATVRSRLDIAPDATVLLAFGWVRPYKNVESLIRALAALPTLAVTLVIAGRESGYPEASPRPEDALGRMRALAEDVGVSHRVRFVPRFTDANETADLLTAADIVALPYLECSGSGQLLLAMTMGRYVLATAAGGMDEYLTQYPAHTLLRGTTPVEVAAGLGDAVERLARMGANDRRVPESLAWTRIAANTVDALEVMRSPNGRPTHP